MKRIIEITSIILLLVSMLGLSGCNIINDIMGDDLKDEISQKVRDNTVVSFNKESLKNLFCDEVKEKVDIDGQIDLLKEFLNAYTLAKGDGSEVKDIGKSDTIAKEKDDSYIIATAYTYRIDYDEETYDKRATYFFTYYYQDTSSNLDLIGLHYLTFYLVNTKESVTIGIKE